jgi:hypothetical protein
MYIEQGARKVWYRLYSCIRTLNNKYCSQPYLMTSLFHTNIFWHFDTTLLLQTPGGVDIDFELSKSWNSFKSFTMDIYIITHVIIFSLITIYHGCIKTGDIGSYISTSLITNIHYIIVSWSAVTWRMILNSINLTIYGVTDLFTTSRLILTGLILFTCMQWCLVTHSEHKRS